MIFKKELIALILTGVKTQTRRKHKHLLKVGSIYRIQNSRFASTEHQIQINNVYVQKLGDISVEEAKKEGFSDIEQFKRVWTDINGSWDPEETVTVYDFALVK